PYTRELSFGRLDDARDAARRSRIRRPDALEMSAIEPLQAELAADPSSGGAAVDGGHIANRHPLLRPNRLLPLAVDDRQLTLRASETHTAALVGERGHHAGVRTSRAPRRRRPVAAGVPARLPA